MISPASNVPSSTAPSIAEKSSCDFAVARGNARDRRKFAVVYVPGIAIFNPPRATSSCAMSRFEISSGPQFRPRALPASSST